MLGAGFFNKFPSNIKEVLGLLIHECGHEYSGDHLSSKYHEALCELGAKIALVARDEPELFYGGDENDANKSTNQQTILFKENDNAA